MFRALSKAVMPKYVSQILLVELALAEQEYKTASVFFFVVELALTERDYKRFFPVGPSQKRGPCSQAFLTETVETGDKNRDDFHCMQMSLVMSMRFFFGDD